MATPRTKPRPTGDVHARRHRKAAEDLRNAHHDGDPCDWCGRPMYRDRTRNFDYNPLATNPTNGQLHADHSKMSRAEAIRRGLPIQLPDRLLHGRCNIQRGEGTNDHLAASNNTTVPTSPLVMPWPWSA